MFDESKEDLPIEENVRQNGNFGVEFRFPSVEDTLAVYLQWEGLYGYDYDILDYEDATEEDLEAFLDEEGIYGYTHQIWDILQGGPAYCSNMDMEDFKSVCRQQSIDPESAEMEESLNESSDPEDYRQLLANLKDDEFVVIHNKMYGPDPNDYKVFGAVSDNMGGYKNLLFKGDQIISGTNFDTGEEFSKPASELVRNDMFSLDVNEPFHISESLNENKIINTDVTLDMIKNSNRISVWPTERAFDELNADPDSSYFDYERQDDGWHSIVDGKDELTPLSDDELYDAISNLNGEGNFEYEFDESLNEGNDIYHQAFQDAMALDGDIYDDDVQKFADKYGFPFDIAAKVIKRIRMGLDWHQYFDSQDTSEDTIDWLDIDEAYGNEGRLKELLAIPDVKEHVDYIINNAERDKYGDYDFIDITADTDFDEIAQANGLDDRDRNLLYDYTIDQVYNESLNEEYEVPEDEFEDYKE